jgi:hypothetical protein
VIIGAAGGGAFFDFFAGLDFGVRAIGQDGTPTDGMGASRGALF